MNQLLSPDSQVARDPDTAARQTVQVACLIELWQHGNSSCDEMAARTGRNLNSVRPAVHSLTDKGWAVKTDVLSAMPTKLGNGAFLYALTDDTRELFRRFPGLLAQLAAQRRLPNYWQVAGVVYP